MAEPETGLGDVAPRKKAGFGTYLIIGVIAVLVIGGVTLFTGGNDNGKTPGNGASPNTNTPVTIPQLKSSLDSLTTTVDGLSGRLANLETQMAGLVAPQVTQAEIDSLQASINILTARIGALENGTSNGGNGGNTTIEEITEWDMDVWIYLSNYNDYGKVSFDSPYSHPRDIDEEDDYNIYLLLYNENIKIDYEKRSSLPISGVIDGSFYLIGSTMWECKDNTTTPISWEEVTDMARIYDVVPLDSVELSFNPDDRVVVDASEIYLDDYRGASHNWEVEVIERNDGTCREIEATSSKFILPIPDYFGDSYPLELVFELYYA